jgi:predicted nucleic acid-binding protein
VIFLIDTDVLVDVALDRRRHASSSSAFLDGIEAGGGAGFVASHSVANFHYLVRPARGSRTAVDFLRRLFTFAKVAPTRTEHVELAAELPFRDFEDALQASAAIAAEADRIVTRNLRDYARSPVAACSPASAISLLSRPH